MKNLFKLFAMVLVAALFMASASCNVEDLYKPGGIIEVNNPTQFPYTVTIYKVSADTVNSTFDSIKDSLTFDPNNIVNAGQTKQFTKSEDGYYLIAGVSLSLDYFNSSAVLLGGNTQTVTIKPSSSNP